MVLGGAGRRVQCAVMEGTEERKKGEKKGKRKKSEDKSVILLVIFIKKLLGP